MKSNAHTKDVIKMIPGIENENTHKTATGTIMSSSCSRWYPE